MADRYRSFAELAAVEKPDIDYGIVIVETSSPVLIMAPHGGWIEPTTSEIASAIAGDDHALYLFEGLRPGRGHSDLHIRSELIDEPQALRVTAAARFVVSVHGRTDRDEPETVWLGGLDLEARDALRAALKGAGYAARIGDDGLRGENPVNICNRCVGGKGLQLELPRTLRDGLRDDREQMRAFANIIRSVIDGKNLR